MSDQEYVELCASDCAMKALDCKNAADYAHYAFESRRYDDARQHVQRLQERAAWLLMEMSTLERAREKLGSPG